MNATPQSFDDLLKPAPAAPAPDQAAAPCCGPAGHPVQPVAGLPSATQPFVAGVQETPLGPVPRVTSRLTWADRWGAIKARWGVGRMDYRVQPGVYALHEPRPDSPVLVTANYKLTFDKLRKELRGIRAWLFCLDTDGVNVWCAAGKGNLGTDNLTASVEGAELAKLVSHRELLLPQLAAPGISAHQVRRACGFAASFGPIRARDIPAFLANGREALPEMRRVSFTTLERVVLIPVELVTALKHVLYIAPLLALLGMGLGWWRGLGLVPALAADGLYAGLGAVWGLLGGAVLSPLLLPWLPGRAFALKGLWPGLVLALAWWALAPAGLPLWERSAWLLVTPGFSSFLAMNFTGASTYTSLSGVKKEMRWAVPLQILIGLAGLVLWLAGGLGYL
ncbi:MAG: acetyl-CoA synthase subunit gamma [Deltaproteobacteria bacterium]|nr:acetyl-CoA synthase subunit gamma [Deltaproteobacteria bacterium]